MTVPRLRTISATVARRLAVAAQRLADSRPATTPGPAELLEVIRSIRCVQIDPISVVARSHLLVPFSRLGPYPREAFDALLWDERSVFEYWAHAAAIVLTEDYPIHNLLMRGYPTDRWAHGRRTRQWLSENQTLKRSVLRRLRANGPLRTRDFEDDAAVGWRSGGWTSGRNVERMLDVLWTQGKVMVVGRPGGLRLWGLAEGWLPDWTPRERLSQAQVDRRAAEHALRALGVATPRHVEAHFTRFRYRTLPQALASMVRSGTAYEIAIVDDAGGVWPGRWLVHADHLPLLERLEDQDSDAWEPRTTLLSPFDNLICDRARTRQMFGFDYTVEIYVPRPKRRFGYYAMPVLHGERLIGRVDPAMDRKSGRLTINAVHVEPTAAMGRRTRDSVTGAVQDLARFLGATELTWPSEWGSAVRTRGRSDRTGSSGGGR